MKRSTLAAFFVALALPAYATPLIVQVDGDKKLDRKEIGDNAMIGGPKAVPNVNESYTIDVKTGEGATIKKPIGN